MNERDINKPAILTADLRQKFDKMLEDGEHIIDETDGHKTIWLKTAVTTEGYICRGPLSLNTGMVTSDIGLLHVIPEVLAWAREKMDWKPED